MSSCAIKRWGTGTPCVKEGSTAASKEMAEKLAKMQAERQKQDAMWSLPEDDKEPLIPKKEPKPK